MRYLLLSGEFENLTGVLNRIFKSNINILYLTNFSDSRYENWTSKEQINLAKKAGYEIESGEYYVLAKKRGRVIAIGKSQEVPTKEGHILFSGLKRDKKFSDGKSLKETIKEAKNGELKIADHPYCGIKGNNGIMAKSKNPEKIAEKIDAFEINGNFYFPFSTANWKAIKYFKKYNKPLLSDCDGHNPKDIGECYNIFASESLDYSSEKALRDSINRSVKKGDFERVFAPIPFYRIFCHIIRMIILNKAKKN